nr:alpha-2-macroglobulin family protein [Planctomycetota bacterium]
IQITRGWRVSVVTERPLYKQTDKVHVRAMVHRAGDGRPVRNASVELAIGDMKRIVETSAHGIASHTFELVDHKVGKAAVVARAGDAKTACRFRVKAFERPTFVLAAEPAALTLRPGETAAVTIRATYVNGSPLVGGGFRVDAAEGVPIPEAPEQTSADGTVRLEVTPDSRASSGWFQVSVRDADGRREELVVPVSIESEAIQIAVHPLSDLAVGVPASFELTATRPTTLSLGGVFDGPREVVIDDTGRAVVELTPTRGHTTLRVIDKASGKSIERSLVAALGDEDLTLALNRRTGLVGETIRGTLLGPDGLVRLDVWKDQTAVLTQTVRLEKGRAEIELPLDARMAGVLRVFTRHEDGKLRAPRATLLVTRGRALEVEAKAAAPHYAPGATAAVDVTVRDKDGRPTSAVLGFWGVDEALLALAPMTEGHERIFDVLGEAPRAGLLRTAEGIDRGLPASREAIARPLGDLDKGTNDKRTFALRLARTPELKARARLALHKSVHERLEPLKKAYAAAWKDIQVIELVRSDALRQTLGWLTGRGAIDADLLLDPWGTPLALWVDKKSVDIQWHSAGPDRRYFTGDDVRASWSGYELYDLMPQRTRDFLSYVSEHYDPALDEAEVVTEEPVIRDEEIFGERAAILQAEMLAVRQAIDAAAEGLGDMPPAGAAFEGPSENSIIGLGGGAGGRFSGRGGSHGGVKYGSAPRPLHVRRDFDPTLIFVPEAIVGPDGKTTLRIPLKDSMTTWRLRLVASRDDGATGVGTGSIRVMQPVHATPWLSPHLTIGDVVSVPVAIRNEEDRAVTARVTATASSHLAELGEVQMSVDIGPGGTGRATFRYRARESGKATVRIVVDTGTAQDVQERVITVHRNARTVVAVANGNVTADAPFDTRMPSDGPGEVRLDLYPSPLAEIVSGFDGLIRAPHG